MSGRSGPALFPVILLLGVHVAMVAWLGANQSPNIDEPAHLAAGMALWQYGSFDFYRVNPPLMRGIAALPILWLPYEAAWGDFEQAPKLRPEFVLGGQFVESHPDRWRAFLIAARWALLPFTVLGGLFCYWWASELFGRGAGLLALALWCFSPNILTWSSLICTDGVAAAMGVGAGYFFWRWLKQASWQRAALAGVFLGLAQLSKMTWVVLFALWPLLWIAWTRGSGCSKAEQPRFVALAAILMLGLYVLNLGYLFDGSFAQLGEFEFRSRLFSGNDVPAADESPGGNRFAGSALHRLPVPLPSAYVRGMDLQRADFEKGMPSYLMGEWSERGWWYYYLVALALKVPLGTWALALLAAIGCCSRPRAPRADERSTGLLDQVVVLAPGLAVLALVSSQDGFSRHFRYLLPALPLAFVWISQTANQVGWKRVRSSAFVLAALMWSVASSLAVYPHTMSYFNELAGGPANGHRYLLGSSFSWAQDHLYLKEWMREHPKIDSPYMLLDRSVSLELLGLRSRGTPPPGNPPEGEQTGNGARAFGPIPGWHVMEVQQIYQSDGSYRYFLEFEPIATVGHSIRIYRIGLEDANRVRRTMGLPEISDRWISPKELIETMTATRDSSRFLAVALFVPSKLDGSSTSGIQEAVESVGLSLTSISEHDIRENGLRGFDVIIVPGGKASLQGSALGVEGRAALRDFVRDGGGYIGICAGAFLAAANYEWSLKLVNARTFAGERFVPGVGPVPASFRGWGTVSIEFTGDGRPLLEGPPHPLRLDYTGGPVLSHANEPDLPDYVPLAYFRSEVWKYPFQKGTMVDTPAALATQFGRGKVILFSPHPESAAGYEHLLAHAIRACAKIQ